MACGKAFTDSVFRYELKVPDMVECDRCGWKRKPKSAKVLEKEKNIEKTMGAFEWRINGTVINPPASRKGDCCRGFANDRL